MPNNSYMLLNGQLQTSNTLSFLPQNRAFEYGDSLFETMIVKDGEPLHWDFHWERLNAGCKAIGYSKSLASHVWGQKETLESLQSLLGKANLLGGWAKLKLRVWREEGGKYAPSSSQFHYLALPYPFQPTPPSCLTAGISEKVRLHYSPWSAYKTGSALQYVVAGQEKLDNGWDEVILLSQNGYVAECGASNIFWRRKGN